MKKLLIGFGLCAIVFLAVAAVVRKPVVSTAPLQIMTGVSVSATDFTGTNIFATAFSAAPTVTMSQIGTVTSSTQSIVAVTASQFTFTAQKSAVSNHWIAIGPP